MIHFVLLMVTSNTFAATIELPNCTDWSQINVGALGHFQNVFWTGSRYLAAVTSANYTGISANGQSWSFQPSPQFRAFATNGSRVVAVGGNVVYFSDDHGSNWTQVDAPLTTSTIWQEVLWGNGKFVAVGSSGRIIVSQNGIDWSVATTNTTDYLRDVAWGLGKFVAIGSSGTIITSSDGLNWSNRYSPTSQILWDVSVSNSKFIITVNNNDINPNRGVLYSYDGVHWYWGFVELGTVGSSILDAIWTGSYFIGIGTNRIGNQDFQYWMSLDGIDWAIRSTNIFSPVGTWLIHIATNGDNFVAVGQDNSIITGTCSSLYQIILRGLEVNQTIQNLKNDIPLVERKRTIVRAIFESTVENMLLKDFSLRGYRGDEELPNSPLYPMSPGFIVGKVNGNDLLWEERLTSADTINFIIPESWTSGNVTLELQGGNVFWRADEPSGNGSPAGDGKVNVTFENHDHGMPPIVFVAIQWSETRRPYQSEMLQLLYSFRSVFPVPGDFSVSFGAMNYSGSITGLPLIGDSIGLSHVNRALERKRKLDVLEGRISPDTLYYGVLVDPREPNRSTGLAGGKVASGFIYLNDPNSIYPHCHEIAHLIGLDHTKRTGNLGFCGELCPPWIQTFPNVFGGKPIISPLAGASDQDLIFGFNKNLGFQKSIIGPTYNDFMSYCYPFWVSDYHYLEMMSALSTKTPLLRHSTKYAQPMIVFSGEIGLDSNLMSWDPFITINSNVSLQDPPSGDYSLRFYDVSDTLINSIPFEPMQFYALEEENIGFFNITLPENPLIKRASLFHFETELTSVVRSSNAPTVEVVFPNGGENITDDSFTAIWNANDLDGDTLTYTLQYSNNGGTSWNTIATQVPDTNFLVEKTEIGVGNNSLIRVIATDGYNSVSDGSDSVFTLQDNAPILDIISPIPNVNFTDDEPIELQATAYDPEDGNLDPATITFTSDLDGLIGVGGQLALASQLSLGNHQILVETMDSFGNLVQDSTSLEIIDARCTAIIPILAQIELWPSLSILDYSSVTNAICP